MQNLTDLHPALRAGSSGYYAIEVPLPDREARKCFIEWYLETQPITSDDSTELAEVLGTDEFANITAGLSLIHIENILLKAALAGTLTRDLVRAEKSALIAQEYAGLLEMMDPTAGFEIVGGMAATQDVGRGRDHPARPRESPARHAAGCHPRRAAWHVAKRSSSAHWPKRSASMPWP